MFLRRGGILLAVLLTAGCSSGREQQEIRKTLAVRAAALNSRNIQQYLTTVSPRYADKGKDLPRLRESLEKNFSDYEQLSYEAETPSITVSGNSAGAVGGYRMKVRVRGREMTLNGTEHLRLVKEPDGWKIIAGI